MQQYVGYRGHRGLWQAVRPAGVLPTAEHHHMVAQAKKAAAATRAADLASLIRDIKEVGATSLPAIVSELNAREVPAARSEALGLEAPPSLLASADELVE